MSHPYKSAAHKNDPKWVKGLQSLKIKDEEVVKDTKAAVRNHGGNPEITKQAAYASPSTKGE